MVDEEKIRREYLKNMNKIKAEHKKYGNKNDDEHLESIYTLDEGVATVLYVVVMVVGSIFLDRFVIYIGATIIYILFKTRHKRRKK